jgi:crotonobetainyl-CoA:carnitine CoA-transferase CaiB-like acyl-CoA transferase
MDHPSAVGPSAIDDPLHGIRVLDLTSVIMGPFATQHLGDLGADVITLETPNVSTNREMTDGPAPELSGMALNLLRNKRSIVVDLKTEAGREVAMRIAQTCDVFVTNLRPGSLARLGLDYASLSAINPSLVYCQAQGFPSDSDASDEPAYDDIIQAATGLADVSSRVNGRPALAPTILADKVTGLVVAEAILAGLVRRGRTGRGAHLEVPMTEAMTQFMLVEHGGAAISCPPVGPPGYSRILTPNRRPARTADGWIHVLPYSRRNYVDLFTAGGREDLLEDPRIASIRSRVRNADTLYRDVETLMVQRTTAEWLTLCRERQIPASEVVSLDDLIDRQPVATHPTAGPYHAVRSPIRIDGVAEREVRRPAPLQGQHTEEVLGEAGFGPDEVAKLLGGGVVQSTATARSGT